MQGVSRVPNTTVVDYLIGLCDFI